MSKPIVIETKGVFAGAETLEQILCLATLAANKQPFIRTVAQAKEWYETVGKGDCGTCPFCMECLACYINE